MSELFSAGLPVPQRHPRRARRGAALLPARDLPGAAPPGADRRGAAAGQRRRHRGRLLADRTRPRGRGRQHAPARAGGLARRDLRRARPARRRPAPRAQPGRVGRRSALRDQLGGDHPVRRAQSEGRHRDGEPAARRAARDHRRRPAAWSAACCSPWAALFFLFRRDLLLTSFDPEFARTIGRDPVRYDLLLYVLIGGGDRARRDDGRAAGGVRLPGAAGARRAARRARARSRRSRSPRRWRRSRSSAASGSPIGRTCRRAPSASRWPAACWAVVEPRDAPARPAGAPPRCCCWSPRSRLRSAARRASKPPRSARPSPLPRGTLPEALVSHPIAVLPFANATGQPLTIPQGFLDDVARATGSQPAQRRYTVPDALQQRAAFELERRGFQVVAGPGRAAAQRPGRRAGEPLAAAGGAAPAGFAGPVLTGTLRRFTLTGTGLLLVQLDLALVDSQSQRAAVVRRREAAGSDPVRAHLAGDPARRRPADLRRRLRQPLTGPWRAIAPSCRICMSSPDGTSR